MDHEQIKAVLERVVPMGDNEVMSSADCAVLNDALAEAPYFSVAALLLLRHGGDHIDAGRREVLRHHLALTTSSRSTLAYSEYGDEWAHFYPATQENAAPATVATWPTSSRYMARSESVVIVRPSGAVVPR